jgi:membrane fusion protein, copper/silver efflux system
MSKEDRGRVAACSLCAAALAAAFGLGYWFRGGAAGAQGAPTVRKVLYWHDPMHPAYRSDKPGAAPDCGMALEPVYEGEARASWKGPGTVSIEPPKALAVGIRVGRAERMSGAQTLRVTGRVAPDETRLYKIIATVDGTVREIAPLRIGRLVEKDELLATYFTRDLVSAQQAYFYALNTKDQLKANTPADQLKLVEGQIQVAEENLANLGMSEPQRREIAKIRRTTSLLQVRAPESGILVARNVSMARRVERSTELFRVADLRRVYVVADLFEREAKLAPRGGHATVRYQGESIRADVDPELPLFDPESRTMKLRVEADNSRFLLRPDMLVQVEIPINLPDAVTVPADSVIDSGKRQIVYVNPEEGTFEPREVEVGWRFGDRVAIRRGLREGERIVAGGTFLVDSESRIKLAAAGAQAKGEVDPACGMTVDRSNALKAERRGSTRYFCSESCRKKWLGE